MAAARARCASGIVTRRETPSAAATWATAAKASGSPPRAKWPSRTAIRSPSTPSPSIDRQGSAGRAAETGSSGSGPCMTSNAAVTSRTERPSAPTWSKLPAKSALPARDTRP